MARSLLSLLALFALTTGCATAPVPSAPSTPTPPADDSVRFIVLQLNDVYEIAPVSGGKAGGLARVATVRKRLLQEDADVLTVMAGDFLSPSALGTAKVDGERLDGKQMVAALNAMGLDWATYGNHEFDLKEAPLRARLAEARFPMVSTNVTAADGAPMPNTVETVVIPVGRDDPRQIRVGLTGVVLTDNVPAYVRIDEPLTALREQVEALRPDVDVVVALTHLELEQDEQAVQDIPGIDMSLGGHEHENVQVWRGADPTPIFKADANARTVYIHRVRVSSDGAVHVGSELLPIDDSIPDDPETAQVVDTWTRAGFEGFREQGFEPEETVAVTPVALDGREASVRNEPTALTRLIADAMARAAGVDAAIYNSGSIRIDDEIPPGPVTQYDVIRVLPFGGQVQTVAIRGDLLRRTLEAGLGSVGTGGYLQTTANVIRTPNGAWILAGEVLDPGKTYTVAMSDYLAAGRESAMPFLKAGTGYRIVADHGDVRQAVIDELRRLRP